MRRSALVLCLVLIPFILIAEEVPRRITLEALFVGDELTLDRPSGLMWLPDGKHVLYRTKSEDQQELWREHVLTGERKDDFLESA